MQPLSNIVEAKLSVVTKLTGKMAGKKNEGKKGPKQGHQCQDWETLWFYIDIFITLCVLLMFMYN